MLIQAEAAVLIGMPKRFVSQGSVIISPGVARAYELVSTDGTECFLFDSWRGGMSLSKIKFQKRYEAVIVLLRLDINGAPHTNPDFAPVPETHLHVYHEGFGDRWAVSLDPLRFKNDKDLHQLFADFCEYCNILETPPLQEV